MNYEEISKKLKGRTSPTKGLKFGPPSEEKRRKISEALKGKPHREDRKRKISETLKGRESTQKIKLHCIFCRKRIVPSRYDRHGLDKIKCISKEEYDKLYVD